METHQPVFDFSHAFWHSFVPSFLHALFVDFWFFWPILIGAVLLRRVMDSLETKLTRRK